MKRIIRDTRPLQSTEDLSGWPPLRPVIVPDAMRLLRVLVVDDSRDAADLSSILLRLWGHDIRVAYSGEAALGTVATFPPDVFLLDVGLPQMSGYDLAKRFREGYPEALMVAVTGFADADHRRLGEEAGFDLYLAKPVGPAVLETLLVLELNRLRTSWAAAAALPEVIELAGLVDGLMLAVPRIAQGREFQSCWS